MIAFGTHTFSTYHHTLKEYEASLRDAALLVRKRMVSRAARGIKPTLVLWGGVPAPGISKQGARMQYKDWKTTVKIQIANEVARETMGGVENVGILDYMSPSLPFATWTKDGIHMRPHVEDVWRQAIFAAICSAPKFNT
jgi:hypothetical protein